MFHFLSYEYCPNFLIYIASFFWEEVTLNKGLMPKHKLLLVCKAITSHSSMALKDIFPLLGNTFYDNNLLACLPVRMSQLLEHISLVCKLRSTGRHCSSLDESIAQSYGFHCL